jgi:hypothetical protein
MTVVPHPMVEYKAGLVISLPKLQWLPRWLIRTPKTWLEGRSLKLAFNP